MSGNNWKSFEKIARVAVERYVELFEIPRTGGRFVRGRNGERILIPNKVACDIAGTIRGNGIAFITDAKSCALQHRFDFNRAEDHQISEIVRHGQAGAISGLIVEASHPMVGLFIWIPWDVLNTKAASVQWDDKRLIVLGDNRTLPDLHRIIFPQKKMKEVV